MLVDKLKSLLPGHHRKTTEKELKEDLKCEKTMRDQLSEKQVDKMVDDSFPASDPPGNY
ncbi:MAG: hypothetical protein QM667_13405 [Asticcacaulis sp.]